MRFTSKEIIQILQAEINWCLDNPDRELNHDQQMGFVNGLRQAQTLIERLDAPPLKYWRNDQTGQVCKSVIQPSDDWIEIPEGYYDMITCATRNNRIA